MENFLPLKICNKRKFGLFGFLTTGLLCSCTLGFVYQEPAVIFFRTSNIFCALDFSCTSAATDAALQW